MPPTASSHARDRAAYSIVFLGLFGVYLLTLHPGLTWGDGPELTAAANILGIPHPPGYPLYTLLCKWVQWIPFGSIAWRMNLCSALLMASAAVVVTHLIETLLTSPPISNDQHIIRLVSCCSVTLLFLSPIVWLQAIQTEVYALYVLLTASLLWNLVPGKNQVEYSAPQIRRIAFIAGLCVVHHYLSAPALALALFLILYRAHSAQTTKFPALVRHLSWGLFPLSLWILLPLRSLHDPGINWYSPHTFSNFKQLTLGGDFSGILARGIPAWFSLPVREQLGDLIHSLRAWVSIFNANRTIVLAQSMPWMALWIVAVVGLAGLRKFNKKIAWGWLALFSFHQLFYMVYMVGDRPTFAVPLVLLWALPLATGLMLFWNLAQRNQLGLAIRLFPVLLVLLPALAFSLNRFTVNSYNILSPRSYAEFVSDDLPPGSLFITGTWEPTADNELHPLLYYSLVERGAEGRDIIGAGFTGLGWYRQQLRDRGIVPSIDVTPPDYRAEAYRYRRLPQFSRTNVVSLLRSVWLEEVYSSVVRPEMNRRAVYLSVPVELHTKPPGNYPPAISWNVIQSASDSIHWSIPMDEDTYERLPPDLKEYLPHIPGLDSISGWVIPLEERRP